MQEKILKKSLINASILLIIIQIDWKLNKLDRYNQVRLWESNLKTHKTTGICTVRYYYCVSFRVLNIGSFSMSWDCDDDKDYSIRDSVWLSILVVEKQHCVVLAINFCLQLLHLVFL